MAQDLLIWTHQAAHMDSGLKPKGADCPLFVHKDEHRRGRIYLSDLMCGKCCNLIYRRRADPASVASSFHPQLCVSSINCTPSHSLCWLMSTEWKYFFETEKAPLVQEPLPPLPGCVSFYCLRRHISRSPCWLTAEFCQNFKWCKETHCTALCPDLAWLERTAHIDGQRGRGRSWRRSFLLYFFPLTACPRWSPLKLPES